MFFKFLNVVFILTIFCSIKFYECSKNVECPDYMSLVKVEQGLNNQNSFYFTCVDQYEAATVILNGTEEKLHEFNKPVDGMTVKAISSKNIHPQAYISGEQAKEACKLANKYLCTLEEWLAACRGPKNYTYPYGNEYQKGYCNEGRLTNPVNDIFGPDANFNSTEMNDPRLDLLPNTVSTGGKFSKCISDYGNFDMHGNLHEWVDHINLPKKTSTFKGGFFVDAKINGPGCKYMTTAHVPIYHDYSLGFRCCATPLN